MCLCFNICFSIYVASPGLRSEEVPIRKTKPTEILNQKVIQNGIHGSDFMRFFFLLDVKLRLVTPLESVVMRWGSGPSLLTCNGRREREGGGDERGRGGVGREGE